RHSRQFHARGAIPNLGVAPADDQEPTIRGGPQVDQIAAVRLVQLDPLFAGAGFGVPGGDPAAAVRDVERPPAGPERQPSDPAARNLLEPHGRPPTGPGRRPRTASCCRPPRRSARPARTRPIPRPGTPGPAPPAARRCPGSRTTHRTASAWAASGCRTP